MFVVAGSRNLEIVDVTGRTGERRVRNAVVMEPRPNLDTMPISEWAATAEVCLGGSLDLLFETEYLRYRVLRGVRIRSGRPSL